PLVAELTAIASTPDPMNDAKSSSNLLVFGPEVSQPERIESRTSLISSSPTSGRANGRMKDITLLFLTSTVDCSRPLKSNYKTIFPHINVTIEEFRNPSSDRPHRSASPTGFPPSPRSSARHPAHAAA